MKRILIVFGLYCAMGGMAPLLLGSAPGKGEPPGLLSKNVPSVTRESVREGFEIGRPLSDREIDLRGEGLGAFPVQIKPGVVYGEDGPVKLWDEVSVGSGLDMGPRSGKENGR